MLTLARINIFFFFNDTATTEIYTLSLHDALPISESPRIRRELLRAVAPDPEAEAGQPRQGPLRGLRRAPPPGHAAALVGRSEEHTSELQSLAYLVCRLLLEIKKAINSTMSQHRDC